MQNKPDSNLALLRVLVVDDYAMTRTLVASILKEMGFKDIDYADTGPNAIRKLASDDYALVICDWNMPAPSGVEVLKRVRKSDRNQDVVFIMLTAENYRHNVDEAISAGVSSYIIKPFTADELITKVNSFKSQILATPITTKREEPEK